MGAYSISNVLLLRMAIPQAYRSGITRAVGDIHFAFLHRWFDVVFVLSACVATVAYAIIAATHAARMAETTGFSTPRNTPSAMAHHEAGGFKS
jgi:hypothetical protein